MGPPKLAAATQKSIRRAVAAGTLDPILSAGPIAALMSLAWKIDSEVAVREAYLDRATGDVKPPVLDTMSLPTYLRYAESLTLTPPPMAKAGQRLEAKGGKLASIRGGRQSA